MESRFKGLSDVALGEAKRLGCTYADIRFTRNVNDSVAVRDRIVTDCVRLRRRRHEESAGFGVRVIHSGVWGFASSPFVTEDEIKKITAQATEVAKASAVSKRFEVKLAPVEAYQDYWSVPVKQKPEDVSLDDKIAFLMKINEAALKAAGRHPRPVEHGVRLRVEVPGHLRRLVHRAGNLAHRARLHRHGAQGRQGRSRAPSRWRRRPPATRWCSKRRCSRTSSASAPRRSEHCTAPPVGVGLKDLVMTPAHAMLTIHEIVAHPTELDRVVGYEANYAGTSFVKMERHRQAE